MNDATYSGLLSRLLYRMRLAARHLDKKASSDSFGDAPRRDAIQRIYVINLDRKPDRWAQISGELGDVRDSNGKPLLAMSRRFSAIDARYFKGLPRNELVHPEYSLADQLAVQPNALLDESIDAASYGIKMTPQEVAVALSHVEVWKLIAESDCAFTLVLEDEVYFGRGFPRILDDAWTELMQRSGQTGALDMLYLSYKEADNQVPNRARSEPLFRPVSGLWQMSGYVLSQKGAQKLLGLLPVRGPVDLWINHQFRELDVFATRTSIIEQRQDLTSTNSYSVLPILSKVGVLTREKPLLVKRKAMAGPVFVFGKSGSGLTALATALSMLGYRCCSDMTELPAGECADLFENKRARVFDAYVNIGSLHPHALIELAKVYRHARFIMTTPEGEHVTETTGDPPGALPAPEGLFHQNDLPNALLLQLAEGTPGNVLVLPFGHRDKWELLCELLGCDYPAHAYPEHQDQLQRRLFSRATSESSAPTGVRRLKSDSSPWIIPRKEWSGLPLAEPGETVRSDSSSICVSTSFGELDSEAWVLRDDTFPSNLALFRPSNFAIGTDNIAQLTLREEGASVRQFTSASIASQRRYQYGRFTAQVRPCGVPGLITGIFLHRNAPRQEIDIEFVGKDPTKLLVNVSYNPGCEGTKLEYGYRGTPTLIDLGFDASSEFHRYEIEWCPDFIRWRVDGRLLHERVVWNPTPIPHLPMEFNVNLWHSRSRELAGSWTRAICPRTLTLDVSQSTRLTMTNAMRNATDDPARVRLAPLLGYRAFGRYASIDCAACSCRPGNTPRAMRRIRNKVDKRK